MGKNKFSGKKSRSAEKNWKGDPLVSPGMICYAGKQEKPFWFSSLDQIVQFGAIIFCRSFKNYFGQFVWIEKKRKATIIVAFHFMKRRLKKKAFSYFWCFTVSKLNFLFQLTSNVTKKSKISYSSLNLILNIV